jgi:hypothetical protein
LQVGQTRTLDARLDIGVIDERVEVEATRAPAERSSAEADTVIDANQIANLPVNGRDWAGLTRSILPHSPRRRLTLRVLTTQARVYAPIPVAFVSRFGNAPNGLIRALNSWQIDVALMKTTKITERVPAQFGVQLFNLFNHTQFGDPNTDYLAFNYQQATDSSGNPIPNRWIVQPVAALGLINTTNNFNNNNDNAASPNTGTGLPRQIQFMLRFEF